MILTHDVIAGRPLGTLALTSALVLFAACPQHQHDVAEDRRRSSDVRAVVDQQSQPLLDRGDDMPWTPSAQLAVARHLRDVRQSLARTTPVSVEEVRTIYTSKLDYVGRLQRERLARAGIAPSIARTASWQAFGFISGAAGAESSIRDRLAGAACAYYDYIDHSIYLFNDLRSDDEWRECLAHELVHAFQDQVFGLSALYSAVANDADRSEVVRHLVEGEATFVAMKIRARSERLVDSRRTTIGRIGSTIGRVEGCMRTGDREACDETSYGSPSQPCFLLWRAGDRYSRGATIVGHILGRVGWPGLRAFFRRPPDSTAQLIDPDRKLLARRSWRPLVITLPDVLGLLGEGWSRVDEDTLGEIAIELMLLDQLPERDETSRPSRDVASDLAASGWLGDRYVTFTAEGRRPILGWISTWERDWDAEDFEDNYRRASGHRNRCRGWPAAMTVRRSKLVAVVEGAELDFGRRLAAALLDSVRVTERTRR